MPRSSISTPNTTAERPLKKQIDNPFAPEDFNSLLGAEVVLNPATRNPNLRRIARNIYDRQKVKDRDLGMVELQTLGGFGAEMAFKDLIPSSVIVNESVVDITDTDYEELRRDVRYNGIPISIKTADDNQEKNVRKWWIAEKQRKSIWDERHFCEYLVVFGVRWESLTGENRYRPKFLIDHRRFAENFDRYAKKNNDTAFSYLFEDEKAIDAKLCIDLRKN
jgi:hypothetical protein